MKAQITPLRRAFAALAALAALAAMAVPLTSAAEDIDIYSGLPPPGAARPNLVFYVDNTANWNTAFSWEKTALQTVFNALPDTLNAGLMLFTETGGSNSNTDGAYVRYAVRQMTGAGRTGLANIVNGLDVNADKSNGGKLGVGMGEVYRYLAGQSAYSGEGKGKADFNAFVGFTSLPSGKSWSGTYKSPVIDACQKSFVIYISNGNPADNTSDSNTALSHLSSFGGNTARITPPDPAGGNPGNIGDEWSRFMNQQADFSASLANRQYATVYTIEVLPKTTGQGPYNTALLKSMASQGGGRYFNATDAASFIAALNSILAEVQAVNSVFAAASLPISVNTQGTYLNQVFLGMFRPDAGARPRWAGNLKQYQLAYDASIDTVRLVDRFGLPAISTQTGFFLTDSTSIWTTSSSFWVNSPSGTPPSASDGPDGEVVEKGGVAQRMRTDYAASQAGRKVFTCTNLSGACGVLKAFSTANIAGAAYQSAFGAASAAELSNLVNWTRGTDNNGDEAGPGGTTTVRPSIHGDIVHSRPAAVDYGGTTGVVVFYGSNDGMVHAIKGDKPDGNGDELWSFVAPEQYGIIKRLRDNTTLVAFPNIASPPAQKRDWGVDGSIGLYQGGGKVYVFVPMRRGGRVLYAFDVTDPANPVFMWRKSSADIPELGQTWSVPRPATLKTYANPVLIMGAGYDPAEDNPSASPATITDTMGRAVLVLDATTGALLKQFTTDRSVPADITLVDSNFDGFVDRAYAGDLGGNLYRIDFENNAGASAIANWQHKKIATLGAGRKFFGAPDVVLTKISGAVMIGSGDREKPLTTLTNDRFYMVKDLLPGFPDATGTLYPATVTEAGLVDARTTDKAGLAGASGWYLQMDASGEKVVNSPLTVAGTVYFSTNKPTPPAPGSCTANLGEARAYAVSFMSGGATYDRNGDSKVDSGDLSIVLAGGGLPPSPVSGTVKIGDRYHLFLIGGGARGSAFEAEKPKVPIKPTRRRIYWNVVRDK